MTMIISAKTIYPSAMKGTTYWATFTMRFTPPKIIKPHKMTRTKPGTVELRPNAFSNPNAMELDWIPGIKTLMARRAAIAKRAAYHFHPIPFSI
jgi:hypothetical protein